MISSSADFFFFSLDSEAEEGSFLLAVAPAGAFRALAPRRELREGDRFNVTGKLSTSHFGLLDHKIAGGFMYLGFEGPATEEEAILKATEKYIISLLNVKLTFTNRVK